MVIYCLTSQVQRDRASVDWYVVVQNKAFIDWYVWYVEVQNKAFICHNCGKLF